MATTALKFDELQVSESMERLPRAAAPASKRDVCVLLIEDSEDAMFLVQYALQEYGRGKYKLEWAPSLRDGLSRLLRGGVAIVLLDLGLPESSGSVSYGWVREAAPDTPVVVLTGDTREETELSVFSSGVEDYLVKDQVSGSLLVLAIQEALVKQKKRHPKNAGEKSASEFQWKPKSDSDF